MNVVRLVVLLAPVAFALSVVIFSFFPWPPRTGDSKPMYLERH